MLELQVSSAAQANSKAVSNPDKLDFASCLWFREGRRQRFNLGLALRRTFQEKRTRCCYRVESIINLLRGAVCWRSQHPLWDTFKQTKKLCLRCKDGGGEGRDNFSEDDPWVLFELPPPPRSCAVRPVTHVAATDSSHLCRLIGGGRRRRETPHQLQLSQILPPPNSKRCGVCVCVCVFVCAYVCVCVLCTPGFVWSSVMLSGTHIQLDKREM